MQTEPYTEERVQQLVAKAKAEALEAAFESWEPTPENINVLPEPLRRYIYKLETLSDPAGLVRENILLKDQVAALMKKLRDRMLL